MSYDTREALVSCLPYDGIRLQLSVRPLQWLHLSNLEPTQACRPTASNRVLDYVARLESPRCTESSWIRGVRWAKTLDRGPACQLRFSCLSLSPLLLHFYRGHPRLQLFLRNHDSGSLPIFWTCGRNRVLSSRNYFEKESIPTDKEEYLCSIKWLRYLTSLTIDIIDPRWFDI